MKIWRLRLDAGKREDSRQYQLVNDDNHFLEDFDTMINSLERQLWKLRELEVHVISGRKEFDISYLWNGTSLFLLNERAKKIFWNLYCQNMWNFYLLFIKNHYI